MNSILLRGFVSPEDFTGNDTEKIQKALNYSAENDIGKVIIGGERKIEKPLVISQNTQVILENAKLRTTGKFFLFMNLNAAENRCAYSFEETGIYLTGRNAVLCGDIYFYNCKRLILENLSVFGTCSFEYVRETRVEQCVFSGENALRIARGCNNFIVQQFHAETKAAAIEISCGLTIGEAVLGKDTEIHEMILRDLNVQSPREALVLLAKKDAGIFNFLIDKIRTDSTGCVIGCDEEKLPAERYFNLSISGINSPACKKIVVHNPLKHCLIENNEPSKPIAEFTIIRKDGVALASGALSPNQKDFFGICDSHTIQNTIAAAVKDGCRRIVIPRYNLRSGTNEWRISESLKIPSDFTVLLDNCRLVQETGVYDHMFTNADSYSESAKSVKNEQQNIAVIGLGNVMLDGGVHNRLLEKTARKYGLPSVWNNTMFYWFNLRGLYVENLHIENQRWWAMTHLFCRDVKLKNLDFYAIPHVRNMDGIDLREGCNHFEIENITGRTGDDVIALTALSGRHETENAVEGKDTDIRDVKIRNVKADPDIYHIIRLLNHDGNRIYNIEIDTIMDSSDFATKKRPLSSLSIGAPRYSSVRLALPGETSHIKVKHITSRGNHAIIFNCTCSDSEFNDVKTFGDNLDGIGTVGDGCNLHNVLIDNFFYCIKQEEIYCSKKLEPKNFIGRAVNLENMTGDIKIKNIHIDKVQTAIHTGGSIHLELENLVCNTACHFLEKTGDSTVSIDSVSQ